MARQVVFVFDCNKQLALVDIGWSGVGHWLDNLRVFGVVGGQPGVVGPICSELIFSQSQHVFENGRT